MLTNNINNTINMISIIRKLLNAPTAFRIKFYPVLNRSILKHFGAVLGDNVLIVGKLNLIWGG